MGKLALEVVLWGFAVPAATAMGLLLIGRALAARLAAHGRDAKLLDRYLAAAAFAAAFFVGFQLLPSGADLKPTAWWQWCAWATAAAALVGGVRMAEGLSLWERWALAVLLAGWAAWRMTPSWESLALPQPLVPVGKALAALLSADSLGLAEARLGYAGLWAAGYLLLTLSLAPLASRLPAWQLSASLLGTSAGLSLMLAWFWSETLGRAAGLAASAMAPIVLMQALGRPAGDMRALVFPWAMATAAMAFAGFVEPQPPMAGFLLVPLAPLALWLTAAGPIQKLSPWQATVVRAVLVLAALVAAFAVNSAQQGPADDSW